VFARPRPEYDGQGHRAPAADPVNHGRAGKIAVAVAQPHAGPELRQPAAPPGPAPENRVEDRAHKDLATHETREGDPFADGADDDIPGGFHEHDLEEHHDVSARV